DGFVVRADGAIEAPAYLCEVARHDADARVQVAAEGADVAGTARDEVLLPAVRHCLQQRDQRRRRGDDDILFDTCFYQRWIALERGAEERLAGQEEDDELGRRLELAPVAARGELADVAADLLRVLAQVFRARDVVV